MKINEKIKYLRLKHGMSQQDLAEMMGYRDKSAISKVERGERCIANSKIPKYAEVLNTTSAYLVDDKEELYMPKTARIPKRKKLPMLGNVACGEPIFADEEYDTYIDVEADTDADFCLTAEGDSMINARIFDGDILFVKRQDIVDNGEIAVVLIGDEATVKRVYYDRENNTITLMPENPLRKPMKFQGEELSQIRIIGKIVSGQYPVNVKKRL